MSAIDQIRARLLENDVPMNVAADIEQIILDPIPDPHDTPEWAELVAATARLGVAVAQWDRARIAYVATYPEPGDSR